jgi:hypothetical protein
VIVPEKIAAQDLSQAGFSKGSQVVAPETAQGFDGHFRGPSLDEAYGKGVPVIGVRELDWIPDMGVAQAGGFLNPIGGGTDGIKSLLLLEPLAQERVVLLDGPERQGLDGVADFPGGTRPNAGQKQEGREKKAPEEIGPEIGLGHGPFRIT